MKIKLTFLAGILFLISCGEDFFNPIIDIELPEITPKLVVYSHLEEGSDSLFVLVSSTRAVLDQRPFPLVYSDTFWLRPDSMRFFVHQISGGDTVKGAHIELYKNNALFTTFKQQGHFIGVYLSVLNAPLQYEKGVSYTLKVSAPGFEPVESTARLPQPVSIDTIRYRLNVKVADPTDPTSLNEVNEYSLSFTDPEMQNDYYTNSAYYFDSSGGSPSQRTYIYSFDFKSEYNHLSDASFDGKKTTWNVHEYSNPGFPPFMKFYLHHISESLYLYTLSVRRYENAKDDPFAEPVILYTNIKNGYGVFSMGSSRSYSFRVR